jgi:hypothetical protein
MWWHYAHSARPQVNDRLEALRNRRFFPSVRARIEGFPMRSCAWAGWTVRAGIVAAAIVLRPTAAHADAIDGHWCHQDGRRLEIAGPVIVTPGGSRIEGIYSRHYFSYVAPAADTPPGVNVEMALVNEWTVHARAAGSEPEVWHRCAPPVSLRQPPPGQTPRRLTQHLTPRRLAQNHIPRRSARIHAGTGNG